MERITSSASFPEGASDLKYASLADVRRQLVGRCISSVEYADDNVIALVFNDGTSATFTPSGTEGDDLKISIDR